MKEKTLKDAAKDLATDLDALIGKELHKRKHMFIAEVVSINNQVYGGNHYVNAKNSKMKMQLIVPVKLVKDLAENHTYIFQGHFIVSKGDPSFGFFQFKVEMVTYFGKSEIAATKEEAIMEITEKGLTNKYKHDFQSFNGKKACRVAIVTSESSKAIGDVEIILKERKGIYTQLFPVKLNDEESIANGIRNASNGNFDVILLVRGGGSETDFLVFNSVAVVEAIFESKTPVISGIGHTDNHTYADLAADRFESTPTKAAKYLIDVLGEPQKEFYYQQKNYSKPPKHYIQEKRRKPIGCIPMTLIIILLTLSLKFI